MVRLIRLYLAGYRPTDWPLRDEPKEPRLPPKDGSWFWIPDGDDALAVRWHDEFDAFVSTWRETSYAEAYGGGTVWHSPVKHDFTTWMKIPKPFEEHGQ